MKAFEIIRHADGSKILEPINEQLLISSISSIRRDGSLEKIWMLRDEDPVSWAFPYGRSGRVLCADQVLLSTDPEYISELVNNLLNKLICQIHIEK